VREPRSIDLSDPRPGRSPDLRSEPERAPIWPQVALGLFGAGWLAATGVLLAGWPPNPQWLWIDQFLPILAAVAALATLAWRLPRQNLAAIGAIIVLFSGGVVLCGAISGIPFGIIRFTDKAGPRLFEQLPVIMPSWWLAILVSSRETARLVLQPWRRSRQYGIWLIGVAALLAVAADLGLEPFAVRVKQYWLWQTSDRMVCWYAAPWVNFLGWASTTAVTLAFCSPWFISKRPGTPALALRPLWVWGLLNLYFLAGNIHGRLWLAATVCGAMIALVSLLAWRGHKSAPPTHSINRGPSSIPSLGGIERG
jgi:hypothetical protein